MPDLTAPRPRKANNQTLPAAATTRLKCRPFAALVALLVAMGTLGLLATDVNGASGPAGSAPILLSQPVGLGSFIFADVALSVNATGSGPLTYQWQFNGTNLDSATSATLTLTNLQVANEGVYDAVVSNAYGVVTSSNALLTISRVVIWGGPDEQPPGLTNVMAINGYPAAVRHDGTLVWWGNVFRQYPGLTNVVALGPCLNFFGEAVTADGRVYGWSHDGYGPMIGAGSSNAIATAGSNAGDLSLRADGTLKGSFLSGAPSSVLNVSNAVAVARGAQHSLALKADGSLLAWGDNSYHQGSVPLVLSNVVAIAAGGYHNLALKNDGTVFAWGRNLENQTNSPPGLSNVVSVAAGYYHSLALCGDGTVVAWGTNTYGQISVPAGLSNVVMIAAGMSVSVALVGDGPPVMQALPANPVFGSNRFSINLPTQSGRIYGLEFKTNLASGEWMTLPRYAGNGTNLTLTDSAATNSQRFYRTRRW